MGRPVNFAIRSRLNGRVASVTLGRVLVRGASAVGRGRIAASTNKLTVRAARNATSKMNNRCTVQKYFRKNNCKLNWVHIKPMEGAKAVPSDVVVFLPYLHAGH